MKKLKLGLSKNPGRALLQALDDLKRLEKDPRYIIDMAIFHYPSHSGHCHICLAGAVMASKLDPREWVVPSYFVERDRLMGVDDFRCGLWAAGLRCFDVDSDRADRIAEMIDSAIGRKSHYETNHRRWKRNIRQAAKIMLLEIPERRRKAMKEDGC